MIAGKVMGYGLLASVLLNVGLGVGLYVVRADNRALDAQVAPLKQAVRDTDRINEGYRTALQKCEDEKVKLRQLTIAAWQHAQRIAEQADQGNEDFQEKLAKPDASCEATLAQEICPALMDY